jgi:type I restriction enzyme R subunit
MRPIFSPSDFVQMKGRGTRRHNFADEIFDPLTKTATGRVEKKEFRLFDFFANCEYFEEKFQYDEELSLPKPAAMPVSTGGQTGGTSGPLSIYEFLEPDQVVHQFEQQVGPEGMRVDRELFQKFEQLARSDGQLKELVEQQNWEAASRRVIEELFEKPDEYFNLERLRNAAGVDRRITIRELIEKAFGYIPKFKSKAELIDDEFQKFLLDQKPNEADRIAQMRYFFEAYIRDAKVRALIDSGHYGGLNVNPTFTTRDLKEVPPAWRKRIPEYVKDYVSLNPFL